MKTETPDVTTEGTIAALDYGEVRVGVALTSSVARLPRPLTTLANDDHLFETLAALAEKETVTLFVVGLPRDLSSNDTAQTTRVRQFATRLARQGIPVELQDEALTSQAAEAELRRRHKPYTRADIDALSACLILEDYLGTPR